jgi:hypothetical protein
MVGQLLFDEIEFDGLHAVAGSFLFLLLAAAGTLLGRGAMAKDGEIGGEGRQQNQTYDAGFKHSYKGNREIQKKVIKLRVDVVKFGWQ